MIDNSTSRFLASLLDIENFCRVIITHVQGFSYEEFRKNVSIRSTVVLHLEMIGEAVKRIEPEMREVYPQVAWQSIAGLRDVLVHQYDRRDYKRIWRAATHEIPKLLSEVAEILGMHDLESIE